MLLAGTCLVALGHDTYWGPLFYEVAPRICEKGKFVVCLCTYYVCISRG